MQKKPFYLYKRKLPSGKSIYYWYSYDRFGNKTKAESTGMSRKNDAFNFCIKLLQEKGVYTDRVSFKSFTDNWYSEDHIYTKMKSQSRKTRNSSLKSFQNSQTLWIKPYFDKFYVDDIREDDVFDFRKQLIENKLNPGTINNISNELKKILNFAVERNLIRKSPFPKTMSKLSTAETQRDSFSMDELKHIFLNGIWSNDRKKMMCLVSAVTGMRFSEVRALQVHQLKGGYINVNQQYYLEEGFVPLKTKDNRFVTIPKRLEDILKQIGNEYFIFYGAEFNKPYMVQTISRELYANYTPEMMKTKKERILTFHSFRHFFNTYLMSKDINPAKVDFMIGHSSGTGSMNKLYTNWKPEMYSDVLAAQEELLDILLPKD